MAMRDVAAPLFDTLDLYGNRQRLGDQKSKVVLVSIWATWCLPCRAEMPKLDRLYRGRKDQGFIVFGLSDENVDLQRKYLEQVVVSYPLLTRNGGVPNIYREIARYPAIFLLDRRGQWQPARPVRTSLSRRFRRPWIISSATVLISPPGYLADCVACT